MEAAEVISTSARFKMCATSLPVELRRHAHLIRYSQPHRHWPK